MDLEGRLVVVSDDSYWGSLFTHSNNVRREKTNKEKTIVMSASFSKTSE